MLHTLLSGIIGVGAFIGSLFGVHQPQTLDYTPTQSPTLYGSYSPTGGGSYRLGQSVGTSDTTIKLSSFKEPVSNIPYTMTYLGSDIEYGTLSPQSSVSEFISFSGITQNGDGSATLTGIVRGMSRTPGSGGCVASTTLAQPHAGQSLFILSNPPCQLAEYAPLRTTATVSAIWTYSALPIFSNLPVNPTDAANKAYVDSVAIAGASSADTSTKGIVQLPTALQIASSTKLGSTGASLGLTASSSTSSPSVLCGLGCIPATQNNGKISPLFFNGTTDNYTLNGTTTLATSTVASTTINNFVASYGTTTIAANSAHKLSLNGVAYVAPSTQAAGVLNNDGTGALSWSGPPKYTLISTTDTTVTTTGTAFATSTDSLTIPAGTLAASSTIVVTGNTTCSSGSGGSPVCSFYLANSLGTRLATCDTALVTSISYGGSVNMTVANQSSVSSQKSITQCSATSATVNSYFTGNSDTSAINTSGALTLFMVVKGVMTGGNQVAVHLTAFSIIATP